MFKFFRRYRRSLIRGNQFTKYIFYAMGEIVLVVIGILIALQINNWNEDRKTDLMVKTFLINLRHNIESDQASFTSLKQSAMFRYHSTQYLIELAGYPPYDPEKDKHLVQDWKGNRIWKDPIPNNYQKDFIEKAFLWTHRVNIDDLNLSTLEELKSTGTYSKLDVNLKNALKTYHNNYEFRLGKYARELLYHTIKEWQSSLRKEGILNSDPYATGDPIQLLQNNPERIALLLNLAQLASWQVMSADLLIEDTEVLLELVDEQAN